jgi:hypothetical protein
MTNENMSGGDLTKGDYKTNIFGDLEPGQLL